MRKESMQFLEEVIAAPSPSGFERPVQEIIRRQMKDYADDVRTDVMGNVIGTINETGSPRVMLAGHCDEVGFMVTHINDDGFIHFNMIGGVEASICAGKRVHVHAKKGPVLGIVGRKAIHVLEDEEKKKTPKMHDLWIDIGAKNRKDAEKVIQIGDPVTFTYELQLLRNGLIAGRAFDDRIGAFIVTETLRLLKGKKIEAAVFGVSTVQEEIGLRGAKASVYGVDPDVGICVEVGHATDFPGMDKRRFGEAACGKGPILHRGANINPVVGGGLEAVATKAKIPYQMVGEPRATGTDANVMQVSRAGVATALVAVADRYMHTPSEVLALKDLETAAKLLAAYIQSLKGGEDFTP